MSIQGELTSGDSDFLKTEGEKPVIKKWREFKAGMECALQNDIIEWLSDRQARAGLQITLLGVHKSKTL